MEIIKAYLIQIIPLGMVIPKKSLCGKKMFFLSRKGFSFLFVKHSFPETNQLLSQVSIAMDFWFACATTANFVACTASTNFIAGTTTANFITGTTAANFKF